MQHSGLFVWFVCGKTKIKGPVKKSLFQLMLLRALRIPQQPLI